MPVFKTTVTLLEKCARAECSRKKAETVKLNLALQLLTFGDTQRKSKKAFQLFLFLFFYCAFLVAAQARYIPPPNSFISVVSQYCTTMETQWA